MKTTVEAIFENGVFKPVSQPEVSEGERVTVTIQSPDRPEPEDVLRLATTVYEGLSAREIEEIEEMACHRFFTREQA